MSSREHLILIVADQHFCVPVADVHDVLRAQTVTRIPRSRPEIAGALNLRGRIVTAIDLRTRLGMPARPAGASAMHVVVHHGSEPYGLVVDAVGEVAALDDGAHESAPPHLDHLWASVACGVYRVRDRLILALDIAKLLAAPVAQAA